MMTSRPTDLYLEEGNQYHALTNALAIRLMSQSQVAMKLLYG